MNRFEFNPQIDDMCTTTVENAFITHFMPKARGEFVKVYLFGLKCCYMGQDLSNDDIAKALDISVTDVIKAWKYWEDEGILRTDGPDEDLRVEFMSIAPQLLIPGMEPVKKTGKKKVNSRTREMFTEIESKLGRLLSHNEQETILSWMEDYGFASQMVVLMIEDCIDRGRSVIAYWDTMADIYHDAGIKTYDELENYLEAKAAVNRRNKEIMNYMGRYDLPSQPERALLDKWFGPFGMDADTVKKAVEETLKAGKVTFDYVDKVLTAWHNGESTPSPNTFAKQAGQKKNGKTTSMPDLGANYDPSVIDGLFE